MGLCDLCKQEMMTADGCIGTPIPIKVRSVIKLFKPIKFGDAHDLMETEQERCHDCNCKKGHFHHLGCDAEACPKCRGQLISCDCKVGLKQ